MKKEEEVWEARKTGWCEENIDAKGYTREKKFISIETEMKRKEKKRGEKERKKNENKLRWGYMKNIEEENNEWKRSL